MDEAPDRTGTPPLASDDDADPWRTQAERSAEQLAGLDKAVRSIGGVLELEPTLQLIVDEVRELVGADYAALGIVDDAGLIVRFITSGISDATREAIGELPRGHGLLGLIIRGNRSYRIPHIADHPDSYGFPANHPPMDSFLGVPIDVQGRSIGRLYLTDKRDAPEFSHEDQALVEMFALHAGLAVERARLHEQVQRLAVVDERERISMDLHDSAIQAIYAVTLSLDDVPALVRESPDEAGQRVDDAIDALHGVIRDIRNFIFGLRPVLLDTGSLIAGLHQLADELRRNSSVAVEVHGDEPEELPIDVVVELLTITREALSNIARHASAQHAFVSVARRGDAVELAIRDDGQGFAVQQTPSSGHHGLANMRARATAIGAQFSLESEPGRGTRIIVALRRAAQTIGERH